MLVYQRVTCLAGQKAMAYDEKIHGKSQQVLFGMLGVGRGEMLRMMDIHN